MRPIKFRAYVKEDTRSVWIEYSGKMFDVSALNIKNNTAFITGFDFEAHKTEVNLSHVYLMQYTGLNDKNGKEIYDGDIVFLSELYHSPLLVEFTGGSFCLTAISCETKSIWDCRFYLHNFEIIGNIHQNPELLNKSKKEVTWYYPSGSEAECTEATISNIKTGEISHHSILKPDTNNYNPEDE